jgi:colanic acid/amylovoran biosynthesis protein
MGIYEIHGAGFENKGAELMLRIVVSELRNRLPGFVPAIDPFFGDYESRSSLKLRQIFPMRSRVGKPGFKRRFRRQKIFASLLFEKTVTLISGTHLKTYGCHVLRDMAGLIDVSGFAFGDQWGAKSIEDFAELTRYYRVHKKPVVLLPQAFGPFEKKETRKAFKKVTENASLICVRDKKSYEYVMDCGANPDNLLQAPDITLFHVNLLAPNEENYPKYICIVPNVRMLDIGKSQWGSKYESYINCCIAEISAHNIPVSLIVHDSSGEDLALAQRINERAKTSELKIVTEKDPYRLKEVISKSLIVIGSRYHSLVAAFSSGVPAIGLGWSHKYEMLFNDFECAENLILPETGEDKIAGIVNRLINRDANNECRRRIGSRLNTLQMVNSDMWDRVIRVLKQ